MASSLAVTLFVIAAAGIVIAQWMILVSTARALRHAGTPRSGREWAYAVVPAVLLVALLIGTWRAMHPTTIEVRGTAPSAVGTGGGV
ncbi:MAG: hypothetical protein FJ202_02985 [Gemmatimonadetes bacterium]|nr:hypothetical protein [Gemmatimonadota bacterium]